MAIKKKYVEGEDYVVTKWGSKDQPGGVHKNYECGYCQFKTLDADTMNAHLDAGKAAHSMHPYPAVDPEDDTVQLNGRNPIIARRLAGKPNEEVEG